MLDNDCIFSFYRLLTFSRVRSPFCAPEPKVWCLCRHMPPGNLAGHMCVPLTLPLPLWQHPVPCEISLSCTAPPTCRATHPSAWSLRLTLHSALLLFLVGAPHHSEAHTSGRRVHRVPPDGWAQSCCWLTPNPQSKILYSRGVVLVFGLL